MAFYRIRKIVFNPNAPTVGTRYTAEVEDRDNPLFSAVVPLDEEDLAGTGEDALQKVFCGDPDYVPNDAGYTCV